MNQEFEKLGRRSEEEKKNLERPKRVSPEEEVEKPLSEQERVIKENLRREIEKMEATGMEEEAEKQAGRLNSLGAEEKISHLLETAEEKGLPYAVKVARKMKDSFIMDLFHDTLARKGLYKKFKEK